MITIVLFALCKITTTIYAITLGLNALNSRTILSTFSTIYYLLSALSIHDSYPLIILIYYCVAVIFTVCSVVLIIVNKNDVKKIVKIFIFVTYSILSFMPFALIGYYLVALFVINGL